MRMVIKYVLLFILGISFAKCNLLPVPPGFSTGVIDLGGLRIQQITNFTEVWKSSEGGPENKGATFYEPSAIPDGYYMLGSYSDSLNKPVSQWVLIGKDTGRSMIYTLLPPIDYTLVLSSTSIGQNGAAYFWLPVPPKGYVAVGNVVTRSPVKPPLNKVRCVRNDIVVTQENGNWIWGAKEAKGSNSFNLYSSIVDGGGNKADPLVPTGTFLVQSNGVTTPSASYLKNVGQTYSAMPNQDQITELMKKYAPVIYFHPDERFFPSSVTWFFQNGALLHSKDNNPVPIDPTGSNLPQGGSNDGAYWIDLPPDDGARNKLKQGNLDSAILYLHIKPTVGTTCTDISTYIFYPYNGPGQAKVKFLNIGIVKIGEHVSDWEHLTLRINNFNGQLKAVYLSQHAKGMWLDVGQLEYQGTKPVVYSALSGHGSFHQQGDNVAGNDDIGILNKAAKGKSFDTGTNYKIISADFLQPPVDEPLWLNYARKWGPDIENDFSKVLNKFPKILPKPLKKEVRGTINDLPKELLEQQGPVSPKFKDNWDGDEKF